jgi:hypothetical protein
MWKYLWFRQLSLQKFHHPLLYKKYIPLGLEQDQR